MILRRSLFAVGSKMSKPVSTVICCISERSEEAPSSSLEPLKQAVLNSGRTFFSISAPTSSLLRELSKRILTPDRPRESVVLFYPPGFYLPNLGPSRVVLDLGWASVPTLHREVECCWVLALEALRRRVLLVLLERSSGVSQLELRRLVAALRSSSRSPTETPRLDGDLWITWSSPLLTFELLESCTGALFIAQDDFRWRGGVPVQGFDGDARVIYAQPSCSDFGDRWYVLARPPLLWIQKEAQISPLRALTCDSPRHSGSLRFGWKSVTLPRSRPSSEYSPCQCEIRAFPGLLRQMKAWQGSVEFDSSLPIWGWPELKVERASKSTSEEKQAPASKESLEVQIYNSTGELISWGRGSSDGVIRCRLLFLPPRLDSSNYEVSLYLSCSERELACSKVSLMLPIIDPMECRLLEGTGSELRIEAESRSSSRIRTLSGVREELRTVFEIGTLSSMELRLSGSELELRGSTGESTVEIRELERPIKVPKLG